MLTAMEKIMPDNFGRMTRDEASPQLTKLLWGDGSITCKVCAERPNCPYVGQVCAMFKPIGQAIKKVGEQEAQ